MENYQKIEKIGEGQTVRLETMLIAKPTQVHTALSTKHAISKTAVESSR